jgi:amino acid transporter
VKRLAKSLSLTDLLVLSSSSMAPAYSLAAVMGLVVATSGTGAPFALLVSTIPIAFIAIGFMRLTSTMPSAGAVYTWSRAAFGDRGSWFTAMMLVIAYYFGSLASAFPTSVYTLKLIDPTASSSPVAIAVVSCMWVAFSTYFLVIGARPTAMLSAAFLIVELFAVLLIAELAFAHPFTGTPPTHLAVAGLTVGEFGWSGVAVGAALSIWITAGWEISSYSSEETAKGGNVAGIGAIVGLLGTFAIVGLCEIAYLRVCTVAGFTDHQEDALAYVASMVGGRWVELLMTAAVLVSSAAALWTTMQLLSRGIFSMGRDGLLPRVLATVHPKYGSPWVSILAVSVPIAAIMLLAGFATTAQQELQTVVGASSIFIGATFIITGLSCVRLHIGSKMSAAAPLMTGIILPGLGALGTLGFLIFYVKTQGTVLQELTAAGCGVSLIFALFAGTWSRSGPEPPKIEEGTSP